MNIVKKLMGIMFVIGTLSVSVLVNSTMCHAAKYNYIQNNNLADNISAGSDYNLSNGWVGCPKTIYGFISNSIAEDGFSGWGSDSGSAYIPETCTKVGKNAFLSYNDYTGKKSRYLGGVTMPAKFWSQFEYLGFTSETPLKSNSGEIICDVSQKTFVYNGSIQTPKYYAVYIDGINMGSAHEFLTDTKNSGIHTVRFPIMDQITGNYNISGTFYGTCNYEIEPFPLSQSMCNGGIEKTYRYTGKSIEPKPVLDGGFGEFSMNTDYSLNYQNNINAGTAEVKAVSKNPNLSGEWKTTFEIEPASLSDVEIDNFKDNLIYQGNETKQDITLSYQSMILEEGKDYTISYQQNENVGDAVMEINGIGNYSGTITKNFHILAEDINNTQISSVENQVFSGIEIEPKPVISFHSTVLEEGKDYTMVYKNNRNSGKATIIITGIHNMSGTKEITFSILSCDIKNVTIDGFVPAFYYTGKEITQDISVILNSNKLIEGTDYEVKYSDNIATGKAYMTIKGNGNLTGTLTYEFAIVPNLPDIELSDSDSINEMSVNRSTQKSLENQKNSTTNITNITNQVKKTDLTNNYIRFGWKKVKKAVKYRVLLKQTYYTKKGKRTIKYKSLCTTKKRSYKKTNLVKNRKYTFRFQALSKKGKVIKSTQKSIRFKTSKKIRINI